jgi:hypothetical protein
MRADRHFFVFDSNTDFAKNPPFKTRFTNHFHNSYLFRMRSPMPIQCLRRGIVLLCAICGLSL